MIERSFLFVDGIGPKTEQNIWAQGVESWTEFLETDRLRGLSPAKKLSADGQIIKARQALFEEEVEWFAQRLPLSEHWRLYDYFREDTVFLDIETCGGYGYVTVIGLYDGYEVKHLIRGANLYKEILQEELSKYKLIVTFNGSSFDLPVINRYFREVVPNIPHMDLRHLCARLGYHGGLKLIEKDFGIKRGSAVSNMIGGDAVMLWDKFRVTEDQRYLDLLLEYNAEDIINLKPIADSAVRMMRKEMLPQSAL